MTAIGFQPTWRSRVRVLLLVALMVVGATHGATPGIAQESSLVGVVRDGSVGVPVPAAFISLLTPEGQRLRSTMTGPDGRFIFPLPGPGAWLLEVERLGYRPSGRIRVDGDGSRVIRKDVTLSPAPVVLDEVAVRAEGRLGCRVLPREETSLLAELWSQALTALRIVSWAETEERYAFQLARWERSRDLLSSRVETEERTEFGRSFEPFRSASIQDLLQEGWIRPTHVEGEYDYFGMDAQQMLTPEFERAHCFRLVEDGEYPEWIGIGFEPVRRGGPPGVVGTLWMERLTAAPTRLEFQYTFHPHQPPIPPQVASFFTGEVDFRELPDGIWIVDRWSLRMPQYQVLVASGRGGFPTRSQRLPGALAAISDELPRWWRELVLETGFVQVEAGGEVIRITTPTGVVLPSRERAALEGMVFDSTRSVPLAGAEVRLVGTEARSQTDDRGRFRLDAFLDGTYGVSFTHPRLDSLGILSLPQREVSLVRGEVRELVLAVPGRHTLAVLSCGIEAGTEEVGVVMGRVVEGGSGEGLGGVNVVLTSADTLDEAILSMGTVSDETGGFTLCGAPTGMDLRARAEFLGLRSQEQPVRVAPDTVVDIELALSLYVSGEVRGTVTDGTSGAPVSGAAVRLAGRAGQRQVVTGREGVFRLADLPPGRYRVEVEHLAYTSVADTVEVAGGGRITRMEVRLLPGVISLEPIVVEVEARPSWGPLAGVYDRADRVRSLGTGHIFDRRAIESAQVLGITTLLETLPGARLHRTPGLGTFRRAIAFTPECYPTYFINGTRFRIDTTEESIDEVIPIGEVELVEVYRRMSQVPAEFLGYDPGEVNLRCGVIAIWTRRGR